jgi:hypothetical protein
MRDKKVKKTFFKFWLLLALGLTTAVFSSCSKEDKNEHNSDIVGTWKYSQSFTNYSEQTIEATNPAYYQEVTFTANGKFSVTGWGEGSGTYKTNGSAISTTITSNGVKQTLEAGTTFMQNGASVLIKSYTYSVEGNTLKLITEQEATAMGITLPSTSWVVYVK